MLNKPFPDEARMCEPLQNIEALTDVMVGQTCFGRVRGTSALSGLSLFCRLHALSAPEPTLRVSGPDSVPDVQGDPLDLGILRFRTAAAGPGVLLPTDMWFSNSRRLRFRIDPHLRGSLTESRWQIFQYDLKTETAALLGEKSVDHDRLGFLDVTLRNPFLPVLVAVQTRDGELLETAVLPFPALCRGGLYYAELCALASAGTLTSDLVSLSQSLVGRLLHLRQDGVSPLFSDIGILARCIDDADALFSSDLRAWIAWLNPRLRLSVTSMDDVAGPVEPQDASVASAGRLDLPEASLPTLHALLADKSMADVSEDVRVASFVVAETGTAHPLWSVGMPPLGAELLTLQPKVAVRPFPLVRGAVTRTGTTRTVETVPFAIKFGDSEPLGQKVTLLMPVSPDVATPLLWSDGDDQPVRITVLIPHCGRPEDGLKALVESLACQTLSHRFDIVAVVSGKDRFEKMYAGQLLDRHFAGRHCMLESDAEPDDGARLELAAAVASGDYLLVADRDIVLHDTRTVSTLLAMACGERVATAGCMLVRAGLSKRETDVIFLSAGSFPVAGGEDGDREVASPIDCSNALPLATYPVAANASVLQLISAAKAVACGGLSGGLAGEDSLSFRASQAGFLHLCTTAVSAGLHVKAIPVPDRAALDNAVARSATFPLSAGLRRLRG